MQMCVCVCGCGCESLSFDLFAFVLPAKKHLFCVEIDKQRPNDTTLIFAVRLLSDKAITPRACVCERVPNVHGAKIATIKAGKA